MFGIGIRYLMGWAMAAADGAKKEAPEWPPHPDRVFMALAAAWFESGQAQVEGEALRWLEQLSPPCLRASECRPRQLVTHFVPVNDTSTPFEDEKKGRLAMPSGDLPLGRPRRPRSFPVAIPFDPEVHLIWTEDIPATHRVALENLCRSVGNIGHSASLVQVWVDPSPPAATLIPVQGMASHRLRVFGPGRLDDLERCLNRAAWVDFHDRKAAIAAASGKEPDIYVPVHPRRYPWDDLPDVLLLATESQVKQHPDYQAAKAGDAAAAARLVRGLVTAEGFSAARSLIATACPNGTPVLASAHAYERSGVNAIPAALAELLSERLGVAFEESLVQINVVAHTGADGYGRLARQAGFDGPVTPGRDYILVDDFVGQGGTLANLRGHIMAGGGRVAGAIVLTGKPYSITLVPNQEQLDELRKRHGRTLESWWKRHFGHPFDHLTQSEARYLAHSPDADTIRDRLAAAEQGGGRPRDAGSAGRRPSLKDLKAEQASRYPDGAPVSLRPVPASWQGYGLADQPNQPVPRTGVFDPRLVVLTLRGRRLALPATLKLTQALRGALLAACPEPIPEWVSGHDERGRASANPHIAFLPLPFAGGEHGDGRLLGVALALPQDLEPTEAARVLEPWLRDADNGLPTRVKLFAGQWLECHAELETRERPPQTLRAATWTTACQRWASVTPVVLDRHFDGKDKWEQAAESVKTACERIGLPRPAEVLLHPVSLFRGVPRSNEFPPITRKSDGGRMHHSHAVLVFDEPVEGPVLIGAGRFRGYGLCRPLPQGGGHE